MSYIIPPRGQKTMAESQSIAIASDQSIINVNSTPNLSSPIFDSQARSSVSSPVHLIDGKTIGSDNTLIFDVAATGTNSYSANGITLITAVSGQYVIRQSKMLIPYSLGQTSWASFSVANFQLESGKTKRFGLFSSNTTAPYDTLLDGVFLESDGTNIAIKAYNAGTNTINAISSSWNNQSGLSLINFTNLNTFVIEIDWLGMIQLKARVSTGWIILHTIYYSGATPFSLNYNQPLRCSIRSASSGSASLRIQSCSAGVNYITPGSRISGSVLANSIINPSAAGNRHPIIAIKKAAGTNKTVQLSNLNIVTTPNDQLEYILIINPTIVGGSLTYNAVPNFSSLEYAVNALDTITVTGGIIVRGGYIGDMSQVLINSSEFESNVLTYLQTLLDGTNLPLVLCATTQTTTQTISASLTFSII